MWLALLPILFGRNYFGESTDFFSLQDYSLTYYRKVCVVPTTNILPQVCSALRLAIIDGFKMDAAKPNAQLQRHNRNVPWADSFIEDIKLSLLTSRVL